MDVKTLRHRARRLMRVARRAEEWSPDQLWIRNDILKVGRAFLTLTKQPQFKCGAYVKLKKPKRGQTRQAGIIRGTDAAPGGRVRKVYVIWPNGWSGFISTAEVKLVPPPDR